MQVELVLGGAEVQQILAGLLTVCLKQVLDAVGGVLERDLLFLQEIQAHPHGDGESKY